MTEIRNMTYDELEHYREAIGQLSDEIMPGIDKPAALMGFLVFIVGVTSVALTTFNALNTKTIMTANTLLACFFCNIASVMGFVILHKATWGNYL